MKPSISMNSRVVGPRSQHGAGLIEVLVAVLVMGIGLLGVAAMQATALRNNQSALERTQATIQTYSILDAMRANRQRAIAGDYNMGRTCSVPATGGTLAQKDIHWDDSRASDNTETAPAALQDGVPARNRVVTAVRI